MQILIGLILAFVLVAIFSNRATRHCRWREYRDSAGSDWTCIHCGARTRGPQGQPPATCLREADER